MKRHFPWIGTILYLLGVHLLMGIRPEHLLTMGGVLLLYYAHPWTRRLMKDLFPFLLFAMVYDFLRIYPKEWTGPVWVGPPYKIEKGFFGFEWNGVRILPNEFFKENHHLFLDLFSAIAYSLHIVVPLGFAFWLRLKDRVASHQFGWTFFWVNLLTFITWILLPVAPPWFIEKYGFVAANWALPGDAAGLLSVDAWLGFPYFGPLYEKSAWVYGAIPSMHAGFPVLTILFAHKAKMRWTLPFLYLFMISVWFAAVYLRHHYMIDLLAGALYVFFVFFVIQCLKKNSSPSSLSVS